MNIPFVNLRRQHASLQPYLNEALQAVVDSNQVMGGDRLLQFESAFAKKVGVQHGVACGNGTDALELILRALDIKAGDEVIVPANGWMSAAEVVLLVGAKPVFVESHPLYYTLDPAQIEKKITAKTKAIIPIHLYGLAAAMDQILEIAKHYHLKVIEDCAQAHGASIGHQKAGSFGEAAAFSFYPTKNLGALGDGGMVVTQDKTLAEKVRTLANHGQSAKHHHTSLGRNSRLDTLQAAVLQVKLPFLEAWNNRRRAIAQYYQEQWQGLDLVLPEVPSGYQSVFHLFVIRHTYRDKLAEFLLSCGIATEIHYPHALPAMPVFRPLVPDSQAFPIAMSQAKQLLSIPIYPELTDEEVDYIVHKVKKGCRRL